MDAKDRAHNLRVEAQAHFLANRVDRALQSLVEATTIERTLTTIHPIQHQDQEPRISTESLYRGISREERHQHSYSPAQRREKQLRNRISKRGFKEMPKQLTMF